MRKGNEGERVMSSSIEQKIFASELELPFFLKEYVDKAIQKDFYFSVFISSFAQAKEKSLGLKAGLGKSTLAGWLAHDVLLQYDRLVPDGIIDTQVYADKQLDKYPSLKAWEKLKKHCMFWPFEVFDLFDQGEKHQYRLPVIWWDDITATLGKSKSSSQIIRDFVDDLNMKRKRVAVIIATGTHINNVAAPLRPFFDFELIVSRRTDTFGVYEVQKKSARKNFYDASSDIEGLSYRGSNVFYALPDHFQSWYDGYRWSNESKLSRVTRGKVRSIYKFDEKGNPVAESGLEEEYVGGRPTFKEYMQNLRDGGVTGDDKDFLQGYRNQYNSGNRFRKLGS